MGKGRINEICGPNSIIKLARGDLIKNGLFITSREFGRMVTSIIFFLKIYFPTNPAYSFQPWTSLLMYLAMGILFKDRRAFGSRGGSHSSGKRSRDDRTKFNMSN